MHGPIAFFVTVLFVHVQVFIIITMPPVVLLWVIIATAFFAPCARIIARFCMRGRTNAPAGTQDPATEALAERMPPRVLRVIGSQRGRELNAANLRLMMLDRDFSPEDFDLLLALDRVQVSEATAETAAVGGSDGGGHARLTPSPYRWQVHCLTVCHRVGPHSVAGRRGLACSPQQRRRGGQGGPRGDRARAILHWQGRGGGGRPLVRRMPRGPQGRRGRRHAAMCAPGGSPSAVRLLGRGGVGCSGVPGGCLSRLSASARCAHGNSHPHEVSPVEIDLGSCLTSTVAGSQHREQTLAWDLLPCGRPVFSIHSNELIFLAGAVPLLLHQGVDRDAGRRGFLPDLQVPVGRRGVWRCNVRRGRRR